MPFTIPLGGSWLVYDLNWFIRIGYVGWVQWFQCSFLIRFYILLKTGYLEIWKKKKTKKGIVVFLKKESVTTKRVKLHGGSNFYYRYQVYRNVIECKQPSTAVSYV